MEKSILRQIIMLSKYFVYGFIIQLFFNTVLLANTSNAQRSIDHIKVSIKVEQTALETVFKELEEKSKLRFTYNEDYLKVKKIKVDLNLAETSLSKILGEISSQTQLKFVRINDNIHVTGRNSGEERIEEILDDLLKEITGTVLSGEDGLPLPGVTVKVKNKEIGTVTDLDGKYTIDAAVGDVLVFSFVGFQVQEHEIQNQSIISITLEQDMESLQEVVVVGYGTSKKEDLISAVGSIKGDELIERPARNMSTNLQGMIPGLTVMDLGGEPGTQNASIRIRGYTSTGNNDPLVIVDGIEQRLNEINPYDIQSVSVLKDAASTAIYGSRAANGVILITTKRGEKGKIQVSYSGTMELQNLTNKPEHMDTESYMRLDNLARVNQGTAPAWSDEDISTTVAGTDPLNFPLPNIWFDVALNDNAPLQNHSLSVSGGNEMVKTLASFNFQDQKSVFKNREFKRYQFRINNDITFSESFGVKADLRVMHSKRDRSNTDNIYAQMTHGSQFAVPYYPDGRYGLSAQRHSPLFWGDPDVSGMLNEKINYLVGNLMANYRILPNLNFTSQFGIEYTQQETSTNTPTYEIRDYFTENVLRNNLVNSLSENNQNTTQITWNNTLDYNLEIGDNKINALLGYSQIANDYNSLYASGRNFYNNEIRGLDQSDPENRTISSNITEWGLMSFFGRVGYSYKSKYLVELNGRYDGSSRFSKENRFAFFPSISAGWIISDEPFWDNLEGTVNFFKLRGSFGEAGNQNIGLYTYYENLVLSNAYVFNDQIATGVTQTDLASDDLTWETVRQANVGVDISLLDNRLELSFDWYKKTTEDILLNLPIPGTVGLSPQATNAGSVENKGWEFQVGYKNYDNALKYSINFNMADVKNKVLDLEGTGPYTIGNTRIDEGYEMNYLFGYETDGLLTQQDFESGYPTISSLSQPGDIKYIDQLTVDTNGDGIPDQADGLINASDYKMIGSTIPRYTYGTNINLNWKNFDFNLQLQGVLDQDFKMEGAFIENVSWFGFALEQGTDYWTEDNPDARFPRPEKQNSRNIGSSDWWVINGAYLRVKNLQLGYNIPLEIIDKIGIGKMRVYVGGTNLLTFSKLNDWGVDAEAPAGRALYHPPLKTYVFGLNMNF
ncbi:TonB-dependent receptor [Echinicola sp. CAU 1574]|uniref:TonB-dependent receptor n=1 Tax=Echinicola arenosa TaxID=2774144 RepID=A0ABR9AGD8_9BACT|nr:TonB-dependent receptor [Echinicola arenosa]MBD8487352.1 TonB-dependent receptor [Echinicola arenosa]